jgi:hypothetical protein
MKQCVPESFNYVDRQCQLTLQGSEASCVGLVMDCRTCCHLLLCSEPAHAAARGHAAAAWY